MYHHLGVIYPGFYGRGRFSVRKGVLFTSASYGSGDGALSTPENFRKFVEFFEKIAKIAFF